MVKARRLLIVNADDFGLSTGINRGIIEAHEHGIVTSASLMVRGRAAAEAADYALRNADLSVGLHLDLAEWIYRNDAWMPLYQVVDPADAAAVEEEVRRQLAAFLRLMGRPPTHLDSHQHAHRDEPLRTSAQRVAAELEVPLRHFSHVRYCGEFYGQSAKGDPAPQAISVESLIATLRCLPAGVSELACHPGYAEDLETMYREERASEVAALRESRVKRFMVEEEIALTNFLHTREQTLG